MLIMGDAQSDTGYFMADVGEMTDQMKLKLEWSKGDGICGQGGVLLHMPAQRMPMDHDPGHHMIPLPHEVLPHHHVSARRILGSKSFLICGCTIDQVRTKS